MPDHELTYTAESPFFARRVSQFDSDDEKLADFLRVLVKQMRQLCKDSRSMSRNAEAMNLHLRNGLNSKVHADLKPPLQSFADIMSEIAVANEVLAESLERTFCAPLDRFCNEDVGGVHTLQTQYQSQREHNEAVISRYLQSDVANFGRGLTQNHMDNRAHEVVMQTRRFEAVRFDLVRKINEVEMRKFLEVSNATISGTIALRSYFFPCLERIHATKPFLESLRARQAKDHQALTQLQVALNRKKTDVDSVLDAMVERVEMASAFLQSDDTAEEGGDRNSSVDDRGSFSAASGAFMSGISGGGSATGGNSSSSNSSSGSSSSAGSTFSRLGALVGGFAASAAKGAVAVKKAATTEDASAGSSGAGAPPALFEDCELRMKALDHSEMVSFYSSNADEEPANLVKQGYLWRKTSRNMITTWERRWFVLDDSKLYYVSEHEDEAHKINVVCELVLANVRELKTYEIPFCFEIAFANLRSTVVQAEGPKEYALWIQALRSGIEKSLVSGVATNSVRKVNADGKSTVEFMQSPPLQSKSGSVQSASQQSGANRAKIKEFVEKILASNPTCAECSKPDPDWVSLNIGCVVCIDCSGVHRSLGVHISKMRSLTLDDLEPAEYTMLISTGNDLCNSIWEAKLSHEIAAKPVAADTYAVRDKYIRAKYQHKRFLSALENVPQQLPSGKSIDFDISPSDLKLPTVKIATLCLLHSASSNNIQDLIHALAWSADATGAIFPGEENPLIFAMRKGFVEIAVALFLNGASLTQSTASDSLTTPLSFALAHISATSDSQQEDQAKDTDTSRVDAICAYVVKKGDKPVVEPIGEALWQSEGGDDNGVPRTSASMGSLTPPRGSATVVTPYKTRTLSAELEDISIGTKAFRRQSRNDESESFGVRSGRSGSQEDLTTSFEASATTEAEAHSGGHELAESAHHVSKMIHDKGAKVVHQMLDVFHEGISSEEMMASASSAKTRISQKMKDAFNSTELLFPSDRHSSSGHHGSDNIISKSHRSTRDAFGSNSGEDAE